MSKAPIEFKPRDNGRSRNCQFAQVARMRTHTGLTMSSLSVFAWVFYFSGKAMAAKDFKECPLISGTFVAQKDRKNINLNGVEMPLGIVKADWQSSRLVTYMFMILAESQLGYKTNFTATNGGSEAILRLLCGCPADMVNGDMSWDLCQPERSTHHVGNEIWSPNLLIKPIADKMKDKTPEKLGSVGFEAIQGMYIFKAQEERVFDNTGMGLGYYKNWNFTWHNYRTFFRKVSDIPTSDMMPCQDTRFNVEYFATSYAEVIDDPGATTVTSDNRKIIVCAPDERWWLAPSCRKVPEDCIPVITGGTGWGIDSFMQKAAAFDMPLAVGVAANFGKYASLPKEGMALLQYWWQPDSTFLEENPILIKFPPYVSTEWRGGKKTSSALGVEVAKYVHYGIKEAANLFYLLYSTMDMPLANLNQMLLMAKQGFGEEDEVACKWLQENEHIWLRWIPDVRTCPKKWGLVNLAGEFVRSRDQASSCRWCEVGRYSEEIEDLKGLTRRCELCPPGMFAATLGLTVCDACPRGTYNSQRGLHAKEHGRDAKIEREGVLDASFCEPCEAGWYASSQGSSQCQKCPGIRVTTMSQVSVDGQQQWVYREGAEDKSWCGCAKKTRLNAAGQCVDCEEGVDCIGMGEFYVKRGYSAEALAIGELSIFKCHGLESRCKGGTPGETCAAGREDVSCAQCMKMRTPSPDGTCTECERRDTLTFVVACLVASFSLLLIYRLVDRGENARQNPWLLLCGMSVSIMITSLQQFGLIRTISIDWPARLLDVFDRFNVLTIGLEFLRLNCVASTSSLGVFVAKLCIIVVGFVGIILIHVVVVQSFRHGRFRDHYPSLVGGLGLFVTVFYISVTCTVLEPLQCLPNPNGKATVSAYPGVICWQTREHRTMVFVGLTALLGPVTYLVHCMLIVRRFPGKMQKGDTRFLRKHMFLFFRYNTKRYWYGPAHMCRSLLYSITPIISNPVWQIIIMQVLTLAHMASTIYFAPWRVQHANILEAIVTALVLVILSVTCLLVEEVPTSEIIDLAIASICTITGVVTLMISFALFTYLSKRRKKSFDYFLCHHKAGACCFTRLLRMRFQDINCTAFLDSDNLSDVDHLFDFVASETKNLIVVCSKEILMRPWCVGEIVTGMLHQVKTVKVKYTEFQEPSNELIQQYDAHVDVSVLSSRGIDMCMIQEAIRWLMSCQGLELPLYATKSAMDSLVVKITDLCARDKRVSIQIASQQDQFPSDVQAVVLIDHSNFEMTACALILIKLLIAHLLTRADLTPHILPPYEDLPDTSEKIVILCSNGAFQQPYLLRCLLTAAHRPKGCYHIPILAEDNFRFPTRQYFEDKRATIVSVSDDEETMLSVILNVFKTIALNFQPDRTEEMLHTQALAVAKRLVGQGFASSLTGSTNMSAMASMRNTLSASMRNTLSASMRNSLSARGRVTRTSSDASAIQRGTSNPSPTVVQKAEDSSEVLRGFSVESLYMQAVDDEWYENVPGEREQMFEREHIAAVPIERD